MTYATVNWQQDDDITYQKLQQMCDNDTWLKDTSAQGTVVWQTGVSGGFPGLLPYGRSPGTFRALQACGIFLPFDSVDPQLHWPVRCTYPPIFTKAPIVVTTVGSGSPGDLQLCATLTFDSSTEFCIFQIFPRDGVAVRILGGLNIILLGA